MEGYPKPRHNYIYTPRYGQRGVLTYAGQQANGAYPSGVAGGAMGGYGYGGGAVGYTGAAYGGAYPVYNTSTYPYPYSGASYYGSSHYPSYSSYPSYSNYSSYGGSLGGYGSYYNYGLYGSMYPLANFYSPYQRSYYNTAPTYGQTSYVYPPGPTTTTTMYHVANSHVPVATAPPAPMRTACAHTTTREDIQMENRRIATERGAYSARKIKPADARDDDPFWCRERNGEWHLRTFYQIENECYPGQWLMDAELGFLVFHRG
ncbi:uncharacterized protein EKO05_0010214 [Ascochyta rabiei]|uniref:Uncharacterized protein n=1 Tax=Didymella rabiei TaxID=5454 RepID=A0A162WK87_DIDRA|nr:uncharacterized protein EKO05_0010214 [Ascochyta rabiei]KZM19077.1 hypothetical protein ST47_g9753 [Ascochyta rabiei]UPX19965.1 hypothetical protein EKO05_0010214 [Ascochyta rabiei]